MRGAGWISMFAVARCQKTPLFFSTGDNKWIREREKRERLTIKQGQGSRRKKYGVGYGKRQRTARQARETKRRTEICAKHT